MNEIIKQLAIEQTKLEAIHKVSNLIQLDTYKSTKDNIDIKNELAYFIHEIINANYFNSELARRLTSYQINLR